MALKDTRFFLCNGADSYVKLTVPDPRWKDGAYYLKMADCSRTINWEFNADSKQTRKRSLAKLKKFKDLINELYEELASKT